ncbi:class I SAM-dependent methyltransferase [Pedobacter cryoconitis]|uniref:SAM-dependent methyltransferase n=1 Tax=Pedobacter cryoconitis TaxID=188932 RepID=A0A7X0J155_9SPHI|nr:class I SAM-dependent methyltransferase [Pedobacter cryoconitis]MBB6498908.1 SAM-dependent methyltransferase [Pedobacter cryoconitis]
MPEKLNESDLKELAGQLGCPNGEKGIKTANNMAVNNGHMISLSISAMNAGSNDVVLEIGPGNGAHVGDLLATNKHLLYYGVDISPLMISEANKLNQIAVSAGRADFSLSDGEKLNFADDFFSRVFTVNTLYFWKDPLAYTREILRVLRPGGTFTLTFAVRDFMKTLPFTKYDFQLYSLAEAESLSRKGGFEIRRVDIHQETVRSNAAGMRVEREITIITAIRPL